MANISHFTQTVNGVSTTYDIHDANAVPRSGTNELSGSIVPNTDNAYDLGGSTYGLRCIYAYGMVMAGDSFLRHRHNDKAVIISGGVDNDSAFLLLCGKNYSFLNRAGYFLLQAKDSTNSSILQGTPSGTLTWSGQPIQYVSDQRLKQQIAEIDDKLLDAWQDVDLVQFKYNDAVDQKGDNARLHTGYVVQQIDSACKSHNVDISAYGLYCHEEYPQETEEIEIENEDGTKVKETKIIREASEHYSLRYTEALIVECKYLRRCIARLTARIAELEKGNKEAEK